MIEPRYFHVIKQHFEEGLFKKELSMQQALEIAYLVMDHVPAAERQRHAASQLNPQGYDNEQGRLTERVQSRLPATIESNLEQK